MCKEFGIEVDEKTIPRIASFFAGGIGNSGSVCGAVIGAVMGIGLKLEMGDEVEAALRKLALAGEFRRRFEAEMETIYCRELTGLDLTTPEGLKELMTSDKAQTVCFTSVGVAYKLVVDLLREQE